jgi:hypothetical protein
MAPGYTTEQRLPSVRCHDFGYLASGDGCCDDAEDSFRRYLAVNRKTLFAALACALLVFSMLGCGTTDKVKSIQLSNSNITPNPLPPGTVDLIGEGGTAQLYTWGNYSNGKQLLLGGSGLAYQVSVTPGSTDQNGDPLLPACQPPSCPNPVGGPYTAGTVSFDATALLTAVVPFVCTWVNEAQPPATSPSWFLSGSYTVTATYGSLTSPPVYVAVASQGGIVSTTNPTGECGPQPTGN